MDGRDVMDAEYPRPGGVSQEVGGDRRRDPILDRASGDLAQERLA
jgi:hypothetical protein